MSTQTTEWFYQRLAEKDAKIEELKEINGDVWLQIMKLEGLVNELAAALEEDESVIKDCIPFRKQHIKDKFNELMDRAREI